MSVWRPVQCGDCPVCGRDVALRPKDGAVMWHHDGRTGRPCRGWVENMRPDETSSPIPSRDATAAGHTCTASTTEGTDR